MKKSKLVPILSSLIMACLIFIGCTETKEEKEFNDIVAAKKDASLPQSLTLLGKRIINGHGLAFDRAKLYFDADGDANTTEVVLETQISCATIEARIFDAKIGDTKSPAEWREQFSHKDPSKCPVTSRTGHYLDWKLVEEQSKSK